MLLDIQPNANAFNSFRSLLGIDGELLGASSFEFIPASSPFSHCSNKQKTTTPVTVLERWWGCSHVGEAGEEKREAKETHVYTHTQRPGLWPGSPKNVAWINPLWSNWRLRTDPEQEKRKPTKNP